MTLRYYIAPMTGTSVSYIEAAGGTVYGLMNYGLEPTCIVLADVTTLQHTAIVLHLDVIATADPIDTAVGLSALTGLQSSLEGKNIPGNWVTITTTYRDILKMIAGLCQFHQRYMGINNIDLFHSSAVLTTLFSALVSLDQSRIMTTANSMTYNTSVIIGTNNIRAILINLANQWDSSVPLYLGGVVL